MQLIDTHAHIYLEEFNADIEEIFAFAEEKNVTHTYMPNIDHTTIDSMLALEERYPERCTAMMGLHPCSVKKDFEKQLYEVEAWLGRREFVAIGEVGTDLHWDKSFWEQQREALKIQAGLAKKYDIPLIIHCRESIDETIAILTEEKEDTLRGIFHCFSGDERQARQIIALGFKLGLGGVTTFKNGGMDKIVPSLDLKDVVLETDSPYLSPVPHRGKRNQPGYLHLVAERVGDLKGVDVEAVASTTTANAEQLFKTNKKL